MAVASVTSRTRIELEDMVQTNAFGLWGQRRESMTSCRVQPVLTHMQNVLLRSGCRVMSSPKVSGRASPEDARELGWCPRHDYDIPRSRSSEKSLDPGIAASGLDGVL